MLDGAHLEDVVVDVDLELELAAEDAAELDDVEEDRPVLHRADEDGDARPVRRGEQRWALRAEGVLDGGDVLAEPVVELGRRHALLELGSLHDGREELVGLEQRLLPEAEVVDANDAGDAILDVAGVRVDLAHAVADDAVGVVVEVRARGRDAVDDAALDERDDAALVQARRGHRAREREEDGAVVAHAALHQAERRALLAADVGREHAVDDLRRGLLAGDADGVDVALLVETLPQRALGLGHGGPPYIIGAVHPELRRSGAGGWGARRRPGRRAHRP